MASVPYGIILARVRVRGRDRKPEAQISRCDRRALFTFAGLFLRIGVLEGEVCVVLSLGGQSLTLSSVLLRKNSATITSIPVSFHFVSCLRRQGRRGINSTSPAQWGRLSRESLETPRHCCLLGLLGTRLFRLGVRDIERLLMLHNSAHSSPRGSHDDAP